MNIRITLLTLAFCSLSALAADITGIWKAELDTQRGLQKHTFTIEQDGTGVTGKANVERDGQKREVELKEGKVEGDTVMFVGPLKLQDNDIRQRKRANGNGVPHWGRVVERQQIFVRNIVIFSKKAQVARICRGRGGGTST